MIQMNSKRILPSLIRVRLVLCRIHFAQTEATNELSMRFHQDKSLPTFSLLFQHFFICRVYHQYHGLSYFSLQAAHQAKNGRTKWSGTFAVHGPLQALDWTADHEDAPHAHRTRSKTCSATSFPT